MRSALLALLLCLLVAAGGCGGDDDPAESARGPAPGGDVPKPAESARQYADRWVKAIEERDCAAINDMYSYPADFKRACTGIPRLFRGVEVTDVHQFGPAALLSVRAPRSSEVLLRQAAVVPVVMIAEDGGKFADAGVAVNTSSFVADGIEGPPVRPEETLRTVERYLDVVREGDCEALVRIEVTPRGGTTADQCRSTLKERTLPIALRAAPGAKPERLGGLGEWTFYGVRAGETYYVIPTAIDGQGNVDVVSSYLAEGTPPS